MPSPFLQPTIQQGPPMTMQASCRTNHIPRLPADIKVLHGVMPSSRPITNFIYKLLHIFNLHCSTASPRRGQVTTPYRSFRCLQLLFK